MAHTKAGGKTRQQEPRPGKRLGLKASAGQPVKVGHILVRQRGTEIHPGDGVRRGKDHTLFALREGVLRFKRRMGKLYAVVEKS